MQKHFLTFLAAVFSTVLVLELLLEVRAYYRNYDTLFFGMQSSASRSKQSDIGPTDTFPFRGRIIEKQKSSGVTRFWLASASYGEDGYLPISDIFATGICNHLIANDHNCQMLNASRAGKGLAENHQSLEKWGANWQPDVVLIYQLKIDVDWLSKVYFKQGGAVLAPDQTTSSANWSDPFHELWENTTLYAQLGRQVSSSVMLAAKLKDELDDTKGLFRQDLLALIQSVRELGAQPVLITFAARYKKDQLERFSNDDMRSLLYYNQYLSKHGWLNTINQLNQQIREVAREEALVLIDLDKQLERKSDYYRDFSHFTRAGHAQVAELIATELMQQQVVQP